MPWLNATPIRGFAMQACTVTVVSAALAATILSIYLAIGSMANRADDAGLDDAVVRVRSVYPFPETVERLIASITASVAAN
jgi:hypothetical protein